MRVYVHPAYIMDRHNFVTESVIRSFFAVRESYTRAGLRETFDNLFCTLDPERCVPTKYVSGDVEANLGENAVPILQNSDETEGYQTWDEDRIPYVECEVEVEDDRETVIGANEDYQNGLDKNTVNDKDELQIIQEIPHNESSLAKTVKARARPPPPPKEFSITENLLGGLEVLKQIESNQPHGKEPAPLAPPTPSGKTKTTNLQSWQRTRNHLPYLRSPHKATQEVRVFNPCLRGKGLLKENDGITYYGIPEILQYFGAEERVKPILSKAYKQIPLTMHERKYIAKCAVQFLKAAYGYNGSPIFKDKLNQLSWDLHSTFPVMAAERWEIMCDTCYRDNK